MTQREATSNVPLKILLPRISTGDLLIPNFQREFVWDPDQWISLFASIMLDYPIGFLLIGNKVAVNKMNFLKPFSRTEKEMKAVYKLFASISEEKISTEYLMYAKDDVKRDILLDGQQRITSLDLIFSQYFDKLGAELYYGKRFRFFLDLSLFDIHEIGNKDSNYFKEKFRYLGDELSHQQVKECIYTLPYTKSKKTEYHIEKSDRDLASFCVKQSHNISGFEFLSDSDTVLYPVDMLFTISSIRDEKALEINREFWKALFQNNKSNIIEKTKYYKNKAKSNEDVETIKANLDEYYDEWLDDLKEYFTQKVLNYEIPIYNVETENFHRLAGIFSVINISGTQLSTFELLLARTATKDSNLKQIFMEELQCFYNEIQEDCFKNVVPDSSRDQFEKYFSIHDFLGEKTQDDDKFPEKISTQFAQVISLMTILSDITEEKDLSKSVDAYNVARDILKLSGWGFGEKHILSLEPTKVHSVQRQAAKQLLRSYYYMKTTLGIRRLSDLPYRQLDLVLTCIFSDKIWDEFKKGRNQQAAWLKKIEKWFWSSLFGGAYQFNQDRRVVRDIPRLLIYVNNPDEKWPTHLVSKDNFEITDKDYSSYSEDITNRFTSCFNKEGYSTFESFFEGHNKALERSLIAFILKDEPVDFFYKDKNGIEINQRLNSNMPNLEVDHIISIKDWNIWIDKVSNNDENLVKVNSRNQNHQINSPLNKTVISANANQYWQSQKLYEKCQLENLNSEASVKEKLESHCIDPYSLINVLDRDKLINISGNIEAFLRNRFEKIRTKLNNIIES